MSATRAEQPPLTEVRRWTNLGTLLAAAFVYSLNARGSILVSQVIDAQCESGRASSTSSGHRPDLDCAVR